MPGIESLRFLRVSAVSFVLSFRRARRLGGERFLGEGKQHATV